MEITLSAAAMGLVPVIMVLTSLAKSYVDAKWAPLVALVLALLASYFLIPGVDVAETVLQGILMALTAAGLYSGGKSLATTVKASV